MARLALLVLAPWLTASVQVTPVQQVLSMLGDMKAKGEKAMAVEKMIFADYSEWVDDETTKLGQEIQTGKSTISKLTGFIEKAESDVDGLRSAIAKLDGEIATNEGEKKSATAQREEEHAQYLKVAADYQESVDALAMAIQTLKNQDYDRPQAMLQLQKMASKVPGMRHVLAALLEVEDSKSTVHGAPAVAAYEFQSGGIIEVLEKLQDKFQRELAETESAESNAAHAFDMEALHLTNLMAESSADREEKAAVKAKLSGESKAAQAELADTKADLAEDQQSLSNTKVTFAEKKSQFEANQEVRAQELEALSKAMEIIANPNVSQSYSKHVNLVQLPAAKVSFLQERSQAASERALARGNAVEFLRTKAKALSSDVLAEAAAAIAQNPFNKVIGMIKDLLIKLKEEAAEEADHKAWCDTELHKNKMKRDKKTTQVGTLTAEVEELDSSIQTMAANIAELSKEQADLAKAMSEATELRGKEKAKNLATIKDAQAAHTAVKQALVVLKDFYSSQAFVQTGKQPVPEMAAYKGMQSSNGGVVGMLEVIETDFARLETETTADEADAASKYAAFMSESKTSKKQKHDHEYKLSLKKDEAEFQMGQTKKSLQGTQEELDKANSYYEYLKPNCGTVHVSYEERKARRKEEIEALKEAYKILDQKSR